MVGKKQDNNNSVELDASLATAGAEVGAVAKADQYFRFLFFINALTLGNNNNYVFKSVKCVHGLFYIKGMVS